MAARVYADRVARCTDSRVSWGLLGILGHGQRAFSTDNSYSGQQIRIERLWREFFLGSGHWRTKEGPDELLWIEDGGTHAVKKAQQLPLPGSQQLGVNSGIGQARVGLY